MSRAIRILIAALIGLTSGLAYLIWRDNSGEVDRLWAFQILVRGSTDAEEAEVRAVVRACSIDVGATVLERRGAARLDDGRIVVSLAREEWPRDVEARLTSCLAESDEVADVGPERQIFPGG